MPSEFAYRQSSGLVRPRLMAVLGARPTSPTLVVAPAGWGKTTLLAQYASGFDPPVAWLRIEAPDASPERLLMRMRSALEVVPAPAPGPPGSGEPGSGEPDGCLLDADPLVPAPSGDSHRNGARALLIIDDLHLIEGSAAESLLLDRSLSLARQDVKVLIGTRRMPNFNLSRHEVSDVDVVDAEQLRFRAWEVERLLREVYREPLPADDVAALSRRVGGWAAGLKLYYLSTRGHPLAERRRAVAALGGRSALVRGYLTRTVLAELPESLRRFLARTCVFEMPTGPRCDQLLGAADSQLMLEQLARRQAFTSTDDGGRTFRYH